MAASRLTDTLLSSFASFFVSPSLIWRGFVFLWVGAAPARPAFNRLAAPARPLLMAAPAARPAFNGSPARPAFNRLAAPAAPLARLPRPVPVQPPSRW